MGPRPASYSLRTISQGGELPRHEVGHSTPPSAEVYKIEGALPFPHVTSQHGA